MTTPDEPAAPPEDDGLTLCQREGTCCLKCYTEVGACCTCDGLPPLWVLETS